MAHSSFFVARARLSTVFTPPSLSFLMSAAGMPSSCMEWGKCVNLGQSRQEVRTSSQGERSQSALWYLQLLYGKGPGHLLALLLLLLLLCLRHLLLHGGPKGVHSGAASALYVR